MRKFNIFSLIAAVVCAFFFACSTDDKEEQMVPVNEVPKEVLAKLNQLGFKTDDGVFKVENGYIVENDILISEAQLEEMPLATTVPLAVEEQYSTNNLVTGTPRTIKVYVSTRFSQKYFDATDEAIRRYNAENLNLTFQRITSSTSADMVINPSPWYYGWFGILGSAGFPTVNGNPHKEILLTKSYYDGVNNMGALVTTIAHEMGHCIGFRHTDYMDRSYSCGGSYSNEGAADVGANHIPGTPTTADAKSWMLACSDGTDRPFNANDKVALNYLY